MSKNSIDWNDISGRLINELIELVKNTKSFIAEQVPDILKQLLLFKAIEYSIHAFLRLLVSVFIVIIGYHAVIYLFGFATLGVGIGAVVLSLILIAWAGAIVCDMGKIIIRVLEVIIAPKIYLIEFFTDWVRQNGKAE